MPSSIKKDTRIEKKIVNVDKNFLHFEKDEFVFMNLIYVSKSFNTNP